MIKKFLVTLLVVCMTLGMVGTSFGGSFDTMTDNQSSRLSMEVQIFNKCMLDELVEYPDKDAPAAEIVYTVASNYCDQEGNGAVLLAQDYGWSDEEVQELVGAMLDYWIDMVWKAQQ